MSGDATPESPVKSPLNKTLLIPLLAFFVLVVILGLGFKLEDPHLLPSVLIDRPFPEFELRELNNPDQTMTREDLLGQVSLVNVWATWCPNCIIEHPELTRIAKEEGVPVFGINYNDDAKKAKKWLARYGDPFEKIMVDDHGVLGIDLGIYGAPETFVVDANGVIQFKHIGIVSRKVWLEELKPLVLHLREKTVVDGV